MKTPSFTAILITFILVMSNSFVFAQESYEKYDHVIEIKDTISKKREWKLLAKPKKHHDHEVIVKIVEAESKMSFFKEGSYCLFYYYMEGGKLIADMIQSPSNQVFDRLHYKWDPTFFSYKFENSQTGEICAILRKFE